jgi:hypothetical protein
MRNTTYIASALVVLALVLNGGGASATHEGAIEATLSVSITDGSATFVVTFDPEACVGGTIRIAPVPLAYELNGTTGAWETGQVAALLVLPGGPEAMAVLIPDGSRPHGDVGTLGVGGALEIVCDPLTPGTAVLGPVPLIRPDVEDTFGDGGPNVVLIRPDISDDPY